MPKISIITPVYKWDKYIIQTIESVQGQNFVDYEHIIINDNSPDNSEELILWYQKQDPRILYIKNIKNLGIAWSRNKGIQISKSKYLCFLDQDDIFLSQEKLQKQYNFLEENSTYILVSSLVKTIDSEWKVLYRNYGRETDQDIRNHLLQSNQFLPCAMMIRKNAVIDAWWFDSLYDKSDDYDLWMKLGRKGKMYCLQEYLTWYRVHWNNTSAKISSQYHMRLLAWRIFWKNRHYYPFFWRALLLRCIEFILPPFFVSFAFSLFKK